MASGEVRLRVARALRELRGVDERHGGGMHEARRVDAVLWALAGLLSLSFLALDPPTDSAGRAGWPLALLFPVASLLWSARLLDRTRPVTLDHTLLVSYVGVAAITGLEWLSGDPPMPHQQLFLVPLASVVATQSPRRAAIFVAVVIAASFAPVAYGGWDQTTAVQIAANAVLWYGLGLGGIVLIAAARAERVRMLSGEQEAQRLARVDGLTGLGNRRALDEALVEETARAERMETPLSVGLVDMDDLKSINDRLGHLAGDDCLRQVAVTLRDTVRAADRCFRWGGDEFVVLLPDAPFSEAKRVCSRVGNAVERSCSTPDGEPLSVSCGFAQLGPERDVEQVLRDADLDLLAKKRSKAARRLDPQARREAL